MDAKNAENVASVGWAMLLVAVDRAKDKTDANDTQRAALIRWMGKTAQDTLDRLHLLAASVASDRARRGRFPGMEEEEERARVERSLMIFNQLSVPFVPLVEHAARVNAGKELMAATSPIHDIANPVLGLL